MVVFYCWCENVIIVLDVLMLRIDVNDVILRLNKL